MLAIRLQRTGRKHEPTFRVVLTDSKNGPKSGKYLENLGWFDTRIKNKTDQMDIEKIKYWISKGAKPSVTFHNYLVSMKVISGEKKNALPKKRPIKKDGEQAGEAKGTAPSPAVSASSASPAPSNSAPSEPTSAAEPASTAAEAPVPENASETEKKV